MSLCFRSPSSSKKRGESFQLRGFILAVILLLVGVTVQAADWYTPYKAGLKALEQGNYPEAIRQLEAAIQADGDASPRKRVEGLQTERYFPYFYLGVAYLKSGDATKAQQYFDRADAHGRLRKEEKQELDQYRVQIFGVRLQAAERLINEQKFEEAKAELNGIQGPARQQLASQIQALSARADEGLASVARAGNAEEKAQEGMRLLQAGQFSRAKSAFDEAVAADPNQSTARSGLQQLSERERQYQQLKSQAESAKSSQSWDQAIASYQKAIGDFKEWADRDRLQAELNNVQTSRSGAQEARQQAEAEERFRTALGQCQQALDGKRFSDALNCFTTVAQQYQRPQQQEIQQTNRLWAQALVTEAQTLARQRRFNESDEKYREAASRDASNQQARAALGNIERYRAAVSSATQFSSNRKPDCLAQLAAARQVDSARFAADRTAQGLEALCQPTAEPAGGGGRRNLWPQIKIALSQFFEGELDGSRALLEQLKGQEGDGEQDVHAFLGAIYANLYLTSDDQGMMRNAQQEFQAALRLEPAYKLPSRLFSPRVVEIFESSK